MGRITQIVIKSKASSDLGFPRKLGVYQIGEGRRIGESRYFNVPVLMLRESELHIQRPPVQLQAASNEAARRMAIRHVEQFAEQLELDILISELSERP